MRKVSLIVSLSLSVAVTACGSSESRKGTTTMAPAPAMSAGGFTPPKLLEGYTRLVANTIPDIPAGADVTHCQYAMAPLDRDMDILSMIYCGEFYQTRSGAYLLSLHEAFPVEVRADMLCLLHLDIELSVSVRESEERCARCGNHVELHTSNVLISGDRLGHSRAGTCKILSSNRNDLLDAHRLVHERVRRYIDKAMHQCVAA